MVVLAFVQINGEDICANVVAAVPLVAGEHLRIARSVRIGGVPDGCAMGSCGCWPADESPQLG